MHAPVVSRKTAKAQGLRFYFTGKACKHGHVTNRYTNGRQCVICAARIRRMHKTNPVVAQIWVKNNPDKVRAKARKYVLNHREKTRERARRWYRNNKPKSLAWSRKYCSNNREKMREYWRQWNKENPESKRASHVRHKSREKYAEGHFSPADIRRIMKQQHNRCAYYIDCGQSFVEQKYHVDHIIPLARKGTNWPNNIQLLCPLCNLQKAVNDPIEYAVKKGRLL